MSDEHDEVLASGLLVWLTVPPDVASSRCLREPRTTCETDGDHSKGCEVVTVTDTVESLQAEVERLTTIRWRLSLALDAILDAGIYPASFDGRYEQRTEFMNGWNAALTEALELASKALQDGDWADTEKHRDT